MVNLGRPASLSRTIIAEVCLNIYWKNGINNISYNDVIKLSKLSKGSFYKLFKNEDDLKAQTLITYNSDINKIFDKMRKVEDLYQMMTLLKEHKFQNNLKYCYFFTTYMEKYKLGSKTIKTISKIETKYKSLLSKVTKKHIEKYNINRNIIKINEIVNFIFNSVALISLLHRNKSNKYNINLYKNSLYQFVVNLTNFQNNHII
tara:strand:+ start:116 stop:724 length:609 start_codon:yes stop_codon:yes gene_type:complete